jgi:uncharacterized membrane-anchored protein
MTTRIFPEPLAAKVPRVTTGFWGTKFLATAAGVATSDLLAHGSHAAGAGAEIALLAAGVAWQFRVRRYTASAFWFLTYALAVFGTGLSAGLHQVIGVPHAETMLLWAAALIVFAAAWERRRLTVRAVLTRRGEAHYWALAFAAFTFCVALADYTAAALHLWYLSPVVMLLFAAVMVPTVDGSLR